METATLRIVGMTCTLCSAKVERQLRRIPGVAAVSVNYSAEMAVVEHDSLGAEVLERGVKAAGFSLDSGSGQSRRRYLQNLRWQLLVCILIALPLVFTVFVCTMDDGCVFFDPNAVSRFSVFFSRLRFQLGFLHHWRFQALWAFPVQFIIGWRFYRNAFYSLRSGLWGMDLLVAISTTISYFFSLYLGVQFGGESETHYYFETSVVIITLVLLGRYLEASARQRSHSAVDDLLDLQVRTVHLRDGSGERTVPVDSVRPGETIVIYPGERIPADGRITGGGGPVDEAMLSGERLPVAKAAGDPVFSGTLNGSGSLAVRVEKTGKDTVLASIIAIVENAQAGKTEIQQLADRVCAWFIPAILAASALTFAVWFYGVFKGKSFLIEQPILNAISVLVISCPCALGLATPAAVSTAFGTAARRRMLIRNGDVLERAQRIDTVVFDKTGTLTQGDLQLDGIRPRPGSPYSGPQLLLLAALAERPSGHPVARALVRNLDPAQGLYRPEETARFASGFENVPGRGIRAQVDDRAIVFGNLPFLKEQNIDTGDVPSLPAGRLAVLLAVDGRYEGLFLFQETLSPGTLHALQRLKDAGIERVLLSGDREAPALAVARQAGIQAAYFEVQPANKADIIRTFQAQGRHVAMVGDGSNDAPALAVAEVSFAVGSGTDIAVNTSDVVLLDGDLSGILWLLRYSRQVRRVIRTNLGWCFLYNVLGIPAAALGLLRPELACLAMAASSLSVVGNSLRLRRVKSNV
ncbi:MAG: cation-translocating P-type ATPase [Holophaga sp.]|nr:cation-translocating P-type ATPase [Holophaga sp.]